MGSIPAETNVFHPRYESLTKSISRLQVMATNSLGYSISRQKVLCAFVTIN